VAQAVRVDALRDPGLLSEAVELLAGLRRLDGVAALVAGDAAEDVA
jgi:hypothetical protein